MEIPVWVAVLTALAGVLGNIVQWQVNLRKSVADAGHVRAELQRAFMEEAFELRQALQAEQAEYLGRLTGENAELRGKIQELSDRLNRHSQERLLWRQEKEQLQQRINHLVEEVRLWQYAIANGQRMVKGDEPGR